MKLLSIRDFRKNMNTLRKEIAESGEVILTANGQPFALVTAVDPGRVEEALRDARAARFQAALRRARADARAKGFDRMTMAEIDAEVAAVRRERGA